MECILQGDENKFDVRQRHYWIHLCKFTFTEDLKLEEKHQFQLDRILIVLPLKTVCQTRLGKSKRPIRIVFKALVVRVC